jgi:radical SAM protein with 4Fe4S-binding SPASM domain
MMERLFPGFQGGCPGGIMESVTFADGSVHPCDYLWEEKFCAGNLFDEDGIERITDAPVFTMLQALPPDDACSDCSHFRICRGGCPGVRYMREGRLGYPNPECPLLEENGDHA